MVHVTISGVVKMTVATAVATATVDQPHNSDSRNTAQKSDSTICLCKCPRISVRK